MYKSGAVLGKTKAVYGRTKAVPGRTEAKPGRIKTVSDRIIAELRQRIWQVEAVLDRIIPVLSETNAVPNKSVANTIEFLEKHEV